MLVREYGLDQWGKLFSQRQLVALTTFARLVAEARIAMQATGHDEDYVRAVVTYLGLAVDRLANQHSTLSRWHVGGEKLEGVFARQALPMVWDFTEGKPSVRTYWGLQRCTQMDWRGHSPLVDRRQQESREWSATKRCVLRR